MSLNRIAWLGFLVASLPALAHADDEKAACLAQHESGQVSRRAGHFDAAREQFAACTKDACPPPVRKRCVAFLEELDAAQPTIVIAVHDAGGHDIAHGLSLALDGVTLGDIPATAQRLDPGEHALRLVPVDAGGAASSVERQFVVREGEKDRRIDVVLGGAAPPPPPVAVQPPAPQAPASAFSTPVRALVGVSGAALVAAGTMSAIGWGIHIHLASECSPTCAQSQVEPLRVLWPASFVALGVGLAGGVVALTLGLTHRPANRDRAGLFVSDDSVGWRY